MKNNLKKILKPIYRFWLIQLIIRGVNILYRAYVFPFLFRHKYKKLHRFKNCHSGERCFIVATGPSLTLEDVNRLKNEYTFGMNSVYKLFDKTDWRPTYYGIVDNTVFNRVKDELLTQPITCAFYPDKYIKWDNECSNAIPIKRNFCSTEFERSLFPSRWRKTKFGSNISRRVHEGTSVVHFILQIIFYMGFTEIYLLGADCNFFGNSKHSKLVHYKDSDNLGNSPEDIHNGLIQDYKKAKEVAEKNGIKIVNATRGGMLEVFERINLEDIMTK